jgi:group I intron endonuclease
MAAYKYAYSGIYLVTNTINGKVYVGSSKCVRIRLRNHYNQLKTGIHRNQRLLKDINKFDLDNFIFELLEKCDEKYLSERETYWINAFNSTSKDIGYNIIADTMHHCRGIKKSEEHKLKLSISKRKTWNFLNPEGEIVLVNNLPEFCKDNHLCYSEMKRIKPGNSKHYSHKSWRAYDQNKVGEKYDAKEDKATRARMAGKTREIAFSAVDKDNKIIKEKGLRKFCRQNRLWRTGFSKIFNGKLNEYRGYRRI